MEPREMTNRKRPGRGGSSKRPAFALLGAIAGITYLLALVWLRWRS